MDPHVYTRSPIKIPGFAFGYAVVFRLIIGVTSRRSYSFIDLFLHSSTGMPAVFCEGG